MDERQLENVNGMTVADELGIDYDENELLVGEFAAFEEKKRSMEELGDVE